MRALSRRGASQELKEFGAGNLEWVTATLVDDNLYKWRVQFDGPVRAIRSDFATPPYRATRAQPDSPYAGGKFTVEIEVPQEYPFKPPKVRLRRLPFPPARVLAFFRVF